MRKLGSFFPLILAITSTILGLFLGEWLEIISASLFSTEARAILTGLVIVAVIATIGVITVGFFAQKTEQREQKWLEIEKRLGIPAKIELELIKRRGKFNKRLTEYIRNIEAGDEILVLVTYNPPGQDDNQTEDTPEYLQSLEEYSRTLLDKAREPGVTYRRIVCFKENPEQGKIKPRRIPKWAIDHMKEMLEIKRQKPGKISLKKSRVIFGVDLMLIKDKVAMISLDVFDPKPRRFRTYGMIIFHNPPNGNIIQQLYELFMMADNQSIPVEKVPEE